MESKDLLPLSEGPVSCSCLEPCESSPSASTHYLYRNRSYFKDEVVIVFKSSVEYRNRSYFKDEVVIVFKSSVEAL
jgi:hypothetical protein